MDQTRWRWPNEVKGEEVYVNVHATSVDLLTCKSNCNNDEFPEYCDCSTIVDREAFEYCKDGELKLTLTFSSNIFSGPRPDAVLVATGSDSNDQPLRSVEFLLRKENGEYTSINGCPDTDFPVATTKATGVVFNEMASICPGYVDGETDRKCYGLMKNGKWANIFNLQIPLASWGASIRIDSLWWIVGSS